MRLTVVPDAKSSLSLTQADLDWPTLVRALTTFKVGSKEGEAIIAAVLKPCPAVCNNRGKGKDCGGGRDHRLAANVTHVTGLCLDFDHAPKGLLSEVSDPLRQKGVSFIWWNTHSHRDGDERFRILVPFAGPIECPDPVWWSQKVWPQLVLDLGIDLSLISEKILDGACCDPARLFYTARMPEGSNLHGAGAIEGALWTPNLPPSRPASSTPGTAAPVTGVVAGAPIAVDLESIRRKLKRTRKPDLKALVENLLAGRALVPPPAVRPEGEPPRELAWRAVTMHVALCSPPGTPADALLHLCRPSHGQEVVESPGDHTAWEHVVQLLTNALAKVPDIKANAAVREKAEQEAFLKSIGGQDGTRVFSAVDSVVSDIHASPRAETGVGIQQVSSGAPGNSPKEAPDDYRSTRSSEPDQQGTVGADWKSGLILVSDKSGETYLKSCGVNLGLVLRHCPEFDLRWNTLSQKVEYEGHSMTDVDVTNLSNYLEAKYTQAQGFDVLVRQVEAAARLRSYDPLLDYLNGLKWDGIPRLGSFPVYVGAEVTEYNSAVCRRWMISAVARAYNPGEKVDTVIILEGLQGTYKSTLLSTLAGPGWFADAEFDFRNKDSWAMCSSKWIIELGEMASFTRAEVAVAKQFLGRRDDEFRPPYGRFVLSHPRRCVFAGTTNLDEYLRDPTGARRFWPVACGLVDLEALRADRDQLWAEAVAAYKAGEKWYLTDEEAKLQKVEALLRTESNPLAEKIHTWLVLTSPDKRPAEVTLSEICLALGIDSSRTNEARLVSSAMIELGCKRVLIYRCGAQFRGYRFPDSLLQAQIRGEAYA